MKRGAHHLDLRGPDAADPEEVTAARELEDFSDVTAVGIDETAARRGHNYITLFHDLKA